LGTSVIVLLVARSSEGFCARAKRTATSLPRLRPSCNSPRSHPGSRPTSAIFPGMCFSSGIHISKAMS